MLGSKAADAVRSRMPAIRQTSDWVDAVVPVDSVERRALGAESRQLDLRARDALARPESLGAEDLSRSCKECSTLVAGDDPSNVDAC
jgi:hypothetical protein